MYFAERLALVSEICLVSSVSCCFCRWCQCNNWPHSQRCKWSNQYTQWYRHSNECSDLPFLLTFDCCGSLHCTESTCVAVREGEDWKVHQLEPICLEEPSWRDFKSNQEECCREYCPHKCHYNDWSSVQVSAWRATYVPSCQVPSIEDD